MKTKSIFAGALLLCTGVAFGLGMQADKPKVPAKPDAHAAPSMADDAMAEMMKNWEAYATPGEQHKMLAKRAGTWTGTVKHWMDPTQPPMESECTSKCEVIMDGRFLIDHTTGDFQGQPFQGMGITGYDNIQKKYVFTWIDNMGTGIMNGHGDYNSAKKTINSTAEMSCPMINGVKTTRSTETWIDDNTYKMEMFDKSPDGKEFKAMEITYKRSK